MPKEMGITNLGTIQLIGEQGGKKENCPVLDHVSFSKVHPAVPLKERARVGTTSPAAKGEMGGKGGLL